MQIATKLAADKERLRGFRANLREDFLKSPLGDGPRYQRNVEAMYQVRAFKACWQGDQGRERGTEGGRESAVGSRIERKRAALSILLPYCCVKDKA